MIASAGSAAASPPADFWRRAGGRFQYRLRETHLRDHIAPLLRHGADGVIKLDLILRGLASLSSGECRPGTIPPDVTWEDLHDLVRDPAFYSGDVVLKRKWVSEKLLRLERLGLVKRELVPGARSSLTVLRDDATGEEFDDPGAAGDSYVTVLGTIVAFGRIRQWRSPQLAAYFACMIAERYARADNRFSEAAGLASRQLGGGIWYRPLTWFADIEGSRPPDHVRIAFSSRTLRRGIGLLKSEGLILTERINEDPRTGRQYEKGPRVLYHNGFHDVRPGARLRQGPPTKFKRPSDAVTNSA